MQLSKKEIDIDNEDFQRGVRFCIEALRTLDLKPFHLRHWSHSRDLKNAPVELSDYLLVEIRKVRDAKL